MISLTLLWLRPQELSQWLGAIAIVGSAFDKSGMVAVEVTDMHICELYDLEYIYRILSTIC